MQKKNESNIDSGMVNVVYATDYNYLRYTIVSMYSMLTNLSKDYSCNIYILVPKDMPDKTESVIKESLSSFSNYTIEIIRMGSEFDSATISIQHITTPTYYRLLLPDILKTEKKCIYIDGDTIVCGDISELYSIDLEGNYIGGVKSIGFSKKEKETRKRLSISEEATFVYVNAGVLLIDLEKMRMDDLCTKMMELIPEHFAVQDQDIINKCCCGRVLALPMYYNTMTKYTDRPYFLISNYVTKSEFSRCIDNPIIIHYADRIKPWNNPGISKGYLWYEYALKPDCWNLFYQDCIPAISNALLNKKDPTQNLIVKRALNRIKRLFTSS